MTKKDYIKFASFFSDQLHLISLLDDGKEHCKVAIATIRDFADLLELDNPRFNRERFLKACGIEDRGGSFELIES